MSRWAEAGQAVVIDGVLLGAAPPRMHLRLVYLLDHDLIIASKVKACVILCGGAIHHACVEAVGAR